MILIFFFPIYKLLAETSGNNKAHSSEEAKIKYWTCSMHPQIRQPKSGKCPICAMDLIPVMSEGQSEDEGPRDLKLSEKAQKLAEIEVAPVERKFVTVEVRMVGKIEYDETKLAYITSWVPGRLDKLYVDYTGIQVKKGEHLVDIYSPELISAQEELFQSLKAIKDLEKSNIESMKETARQTVEAVREKLRLLGLSKEQIEEIEKSEKPSDHITIYSPISGIVIQKNALQGMYVDTGTQIYTIADLSQVWVKLDAYESDIEWLRYGQEVEFQAESYPGEVFKGKISFIDPIVNEKTRTVKLRVNVPNPDGKLKPEMFVRAIVHSKVATGGKVMDESLAGKWICPMHPEVVKSSSGSCDICGMALVPAESLGYVKPDAKPPIIIPASAPLITGKRAVVYVEVKDKEGVYEGREIVLGPRAGDFYVVKEGLNEGENIVVNGNFKIDSAIQILAKPSMMNPEGGGPVPTHQHNAVAQVEPSKKVEKSQEAKSKEEKEQTFNVPDEFKKQLDGIFDSYFSIHQALSQDKFVEAKDNAKKFVDALDTIDMTLLDHTTHLEWMKKYEELKKNAQDISNSKDIAKTRESFSPLSVSMIEVAKKFGTSNKQPIIRFHCPMAFNNKGADWLQTKKEIENPYFGKTMFSCGEQVEVIFKGHK